MATKFSVNGTTSLSACPAAYPVAFPMSRAYSNVLKLRSQFKQTCGNVNSGLQKTQNPQNFSHKNFGNNYTMSALGIVSNQSRPWR